MPSRQNLFERIHSLWMENLVLVFPNQSLNDEQHIKFGSQFGELEVHPRWRIDRRKIEKSIEFLMLTRAVISFNPVRRLGSTLIFRGFGIQIAHFGTFLVRGQYCTA